MAFIKSDKTIVVWILTISAVLFGLMTIKAGGQVLFGGGEYETRTVAAISLRSLVWISIYLFSYRELIRR